MGYEIHHGDCRVVLDLMPSNSIDACVTDPPYHFQSIQKRFAKVGRTDKTWSKSGPHQRTARGFMNQTWDGGDIAFDPEMWAAVERVLKPGAHLLAFGGTRTFHRMACAIEDAGFELRDTIMWVYGSGFPKSHNQEGEWAGWGTALKPAWEPIIVARKPLDGTVSGNLNKWGVGALNIDGCRVDFTSAEDEEEEEAKNKNRHSDFGSGPMTNQVFGKFAKNRDNYDPIGRWPANLIHDGSADVLAAFPVSKSSAGKPRSGKSGNGWGMHATGAEYNDSGSAARFFYCAKASREDRNDGLADFEEKPLLWSAGTQNPGSFQSEGTKKKAQNPHPTVKPTPLMEYLCRLPTPPGGTILDPYAGSGSTGRGALLGGFNFIGIEQDASYVDIARARVAAVSRVADIFE